MTGSHSNNDHNKLYNTNNYCGHCQNDQIYYITKITDKVIGTMTGSNSNNDQTDYIIQITDKVIVTMTGGHSNNDQTDYIKQITDKVIGQWPQISMQISNQTRSF